MGPVELSDWVVAISAETGRALRIRLLIVVAIITYPFLSLRICCVYVIVSFEMHLIGEPSKGAHIDSELGVRIRVAEIDGDALTSTVDDGDAFLLESLRLACCCVTAVSAVGDGSGRRDDSMPWDGGVLEEFEGGADETRMGGVADEACDVAVGGYASGRDEAGDVVDLSCGVCGSRIGKRGDENR
ncbi:C2H2 transcription factor [Pseudozyma hubeiensis SY62]|uniref:C2H2 transcription factor n=1 Tax=Pseudozyma hubeiensis (strain SY62) TaxID=1305764 RepID=R9P210_PSEHS|nr:C2H2 transcription factor [Pseudozyma hubeiensis SY62]GAC95358.1 C2H2 transcription factor [Pseudozyma hubeiensis SY62]